MNKACHFFISGKFNMDMDCSKLAELVTTLLMKIPEGAVGKIGENITDGIWKKLHSRLSARPAALAAAHNAAAAPNDADAQAAFRFQVKKLLEEDPDFAQEIAALLPAVTGNSVQNSPTTASGPGSVAVAISTGTIKTETHHHYHKDSEKND
jgi:hypothetical protein